MSPESAANAGPYVLPPIVLATEPASGTTSEVATSGVESVPTAPVAPIVPTVAPAPAGTDRSFIAAISGCDERDTNLVG